MSTIVICAMYKFVRIDELQNVRDQLLAVFNQWAIKGTILLAAEGINGTVAGSREAIDALLLHIEKDTPVGSMEVKESYSHRVPFVRSKVKIKEEIVTMGVAEVDPNRQVGVYLSAKEWNECISDPEVITIDTRNDYEVEVGQFAKAHNPMTANFREFPDYVKNNLNPNKHKKIAMYCTGGIRCEKASSYMKSQGFAEVYHLRGGILKYLEDVKPEESLWQGECFVFDDRVAVNHQLQPGSYALCYACRLPLASEDLQHPHYQKGVHCHRCYGKTSERQVSSFQERSKQMGLAEGRDYPHLGSDVVISAKQRRELKQKQRDLALQPVRISEDR